MPCSVLNSVHWRLHWILKVSLGEREAAACNIQNWARTNSHDPFIIMTHTHYITHSYIYSTTILWVHVTCQLIITTGTVTIITQLQYSNLNTVHVPILQNSNQSQPIQPWLSPWLHNTLGEHCKNVNMNMYSMLIMISLQYSEYSWLTSYHLAEYIIIAPVWILLPVSFTRDVLNYYNSYAVATSRQSYYYNSELYVYIICI